jgi:hypothetical protein
MARPATLAVAALIGLLLAGCSGGFTQTGVSLPAASDGVQTVSDVADALDTHRSSASENAKAAIGATDALGSFVRDISDAERTLYGSDRANSGRSQPNRGLAILVHRNATHGPGAKTLRTLSQLVTPDDKRVVSGSDVVMQPSLGNVTDFCESSAGYSPTGIPSLDVTFGWQSGAFSGGARATDDRGIATWSANASGTIVQGAIGALSMKPHGAGITCPMSSPAFGLDGAEVTNAFSIPITLAFHHGALSNLSVTHAAFANGESLDASAAASRQSVEIHGIVRNGRTQVATFRTAGSGDGTLTITSTGAQYVIADWIVVST